MIVRALHPTDYEVASAKLLLLVPAAVDEIRIGGVRGARRCRSGSGFTGRKSALDLYLFQASPMGGLEGDGRYSGGSGL